MKKENNEDKSFGFYHIYNRGVNKCNIFSDHGDRLKILHSIEKFRLKNKIEYVDVHAYCLMDNHFHLILEEKEECGVSRFMQRLGSGYTNYYNRKYTRTGSLFGTRYKRKVVENDRYLWHLFRYIHLNPLKYIYSNWRSGSTDIEKSIKFIRNFEWSSLRLLFKDQDYFINENLIKGEFKDFFDYQGFLMDWIKFGVPSNFSFK